MHVSRIKARMLARNPTGAISKGAQVALLVCGLLGIAPALPVSVGTIASPNSIVVRRDSLRSMGVNQKGKDSPAR